MEKSEIKYSLKNIPIPPKKSYQLNLIDKIGSLVKHMRWRVFYYLNQQKCDNEIKETFHSKSRCPPPCSDLIPFEKDLSDMVTSLKFRHVKDSFQRELNEDIRKIKSSPNVFLFATKQITSTKGQKTITRNFYMTMLLKLIKRHHPN